MANGTTFQQVAETKTFQNPQSLADDAAYTGLYYVWMLKEALNSNESINMQALLSGALHQNKYEAVKKIFSKHRDDILSESADQDDLAYLKGRVLEAEYNLKNGDMQEYRKVLGVMRNFLTSKNYNESPKSDNKSADQIAEDLAYLGGKVFEADLSLQLGEMSDYRNHLRVIKDFITTESYLKSFVVGHSDATHRLNKMTGSFEKAINKATVAPAARTTAPIAPAVKTKPTQQTQRSASAVIQQMARRGLKGAGRLFARPFKEMGRALQWAGDKLTGTTPTLANQLMAQPAVQPAAKSLTPDELAQKTGLNFAQKIYVQGYAKNIMKEMEGREWQGLSEQDFLGKLHHRINDDPLVKEDGSTRLGDYARMYILKERAKAAKEEAVARREAAQTEAGVNGDYALKSVRPTSSADDLDQLKARAVKSFTQAQAEATAAVRKTAPKPANPGPRHP